MAEKEFRHLVRISNTDLDGNKQIVYALGKIKGVGFQFANMLCTLANISKAKITGDLSDEEIKKLDMLIKDPAKAGSPVWMLNRRRTYEEDSNQHLVTGDLAFAIDNDLKRMKMIKCFRGVRHILGLPVRGQRTKSNFRKNKGKVKGVVKRAGTKPGRV